MASWQGGIERQAGKVPWGPGHVQEKLSMEELDLSPRNSTKTAREVLSRASVWAGGPRGAKQQETPKLPSNSEILTLGSETRILSSSFSHVLYASSIHSDPQNPRSKNVKTPQNFSHLLVFSSGEPKSWVL